MTFGDEELMAMYSAGLTEAFDKLYERYRHSIYRFALACLNNTADAEDTVQEVFSRVAQSAKRYQPQGRFRSWLFQIAANRIRSLAVHRNRPDIKTVPMNADNKPEPVSTDQPEAQTIARDLIRQSLAQLPQDRKMIVILREVEGLDNRTIARTLDMTHEYVRVQLHRARKQMMHFLTQTHPHNGGNLTT
jgi:RNA polymerase sigma-70 factor, ECF subfamily